MAVVNDGDGRKFEVLSTDAGPDLVIEYEGIDEDPDGVHVWINTQDCRFEGTILGSGATRQEAVDDALQMIVQMVNLLRGGSKWI